MAFQRCRRASTPPPTVEYLSAVFPAVGLQKGLPLSTEGPASHQTLLEVLGQYKPHPQ